MSEHPRLTELVARARERARHGAPVLALVHPGDALAMQAAAAIRDAGIARPLLVGEHEEILRAAGQAEVDVGGFEIVATGTGGPAAAKRATALAREGVVAMLMKGSLHTDELMSAVVARTDGLRGEGRISACFCLRPAALSQAAGAGRLRRQHRTRPENQAAHRRQRGAHAAGAWASPSPRSVW